MRREQILKICLNHVLTKDVDYLPKDEKSWLFYVADYSEGQLAHEQFCLRFKNNDIAQDFKDAVSRAVSTTAVGDGDKGKDVTDNNNNKGKDLLVTNNEQLLMYSGLAVLTVAVLLMYLKKSSSS